MYRLINRLNVPVATRTKTPADASLLSAAEIAVAVKRIGARFNVPLASAAGYRFTEFGANGNTPHQKACAIYLKTRDRREVRRYLAERIGNFNPSSLAESIFGPGSSSIEPLNSLPPLTRFQPWEHRVVTVSGFMGQYGQKLGTYSEELLNQQVDKIVKIIISLEKYGYSPEDFPKGFIRGYFLFYNRQFRFIITEGVHRTAALASLGENQVVVRPTSKGPGIVDAAGVDDWPHVRSGYCTRELALRMVERYFGGESPV